MTPLQLIRSPPRSPTAARLVTPRLVRRIVTPTAASRRSLRRSAERVLSDDHVAHDPQSCSSACRAGHRPQAAIPGFVVAGKTGTAQIAGVGGYQPGRYVSSFVGMAPARTPASSVSCSSRSRGASTTAATSPRPLFSRRSSRRRSGSCASRRRSSRLPETLLASRSSREQSGIPRASFPLRCAPPSRRKRPSLPPRPLRLRAALPPRSDSPRGRLWRSSRGTGSTPALKAPVSSSCRTRPPGVPIRPGTTCRLLPRRTRAAPARASAGRRRLRLRPGP